MNSWLIRRGYLLACVLALAALVGTYANHFRNEFHFDDDHTITNNPWIRDIRNIPQFFKSARMFSANPTHQSYRPLVTTTLAIDYRVAKGLNPLVFHATSFTLFTVQCAAMLVVLRRILDRAKPHPWNRWLALFAAAWYGLHAANAETVNYIISRSEILSTLGVVLALLLFSSDGRARRWQLYLIPVAAAVFAKEQGAMIAALLFFYVAFFEHEVSLRDLLQPRRFGAVVRVTWPAFVVCGSLLAISMKLADSWVPGGTSRLSYMMTQPFVLLHYALSFVLPLNLSADTDWRLISNPFDDRLLIGIIFIGCALWAAVAASRRRETRPIAFGILWFFLSLLPTSSIIPLAEVTNDHRMYFPFVGAVLAASCLIGLMLRRHERHWLKRVTVLGCAVILAGHAYGTHRRNEVWRTEESLWRDVTQKSPENGRGLMNYGLIRMDQGDLAGAENYFNRALVYSPNYGYLHINIAVLKSWLGKSAEAEQQFQFAQQVDPENPASYYHYARWLRSERRADEALMMARRAVDMNASFIKARHLILEILADREDWSTLESIAQDTLRIEPHDDVAGTWLERARQHPSTPPLQKAGGIGAEHWLDLGTFQLHNGEFEDAVASSREAIRLRPNYAAAYNTICAAENARGSYDAAVAACKQALAIQPDMSLARNNLATAVAKRKPKTE